MAKKNLSQSPMPKFKEVDTWKGVADMDKSDIACRHGEDKEAYRVQGDEWESGVVYPQPMNESSYMSCTWPTRAVPNRFGR